MAISRSDMERQLRNMGGIMSLQEPRQGYIARGHQKRCNCHNAES